MKILFLLCTILNPTSHAASINPLKAPVWSDDAKYSSQNVNSLPLLDENYYSFAGIQYGFKSGYGVDALISRKISRYLFLSGRLFLGSLKSSSLVRSPLFGETPPNSAEYSEILNGSENWFSLVPEIGLTVHSHFISYEMDLWSESAWFGFGKAFIGGRSGWAISFEPGLNKRFSASSRWGWSIRGKYTFGWLFPKRDELGTIPYDWLNLTAGISYQW